MIYYTADNPYYGCHMERNDEFEQLMKDLPTETDSTARHALLARAQQLMYDMANIIPLYDRKGNYSCGPAVVYDYPISAATAIYYFAKAVPAGAN